jgi:hypothetical protein
MSTKYLGVKRIRGEIVNGLSEDKPRPVAEGGRRRAEFLGKTKKIPVKSPINLFYSFIGKVGLGPKRLLRFSRTPLGYQPCSRNSFGLGYFC